MKKVLLLSLSVLMCAAALAQTRTGSVSGKLIGKQSGTPLDYAAVALCEATSHQSLNGTITDSLGVFRLGGIKYGTYVLVCSYVGCADYVTQPFTVNADNLSTDFKDIIIDDSGLALSEVVVTGKRSTYVQSIDKKTFNVGSDITSGSGAVSELLQNVPSVQVDVDGNVSLRGNDNVQVLINGKPSVMMRGANRGTVLQQLPASSIERIEVITNPSAQFKPDGTSGIINLIMKEEQATGLNGSVMANVGNNGRYNGGVSLGWNTQKFGIRANYGYRVDRRDRQTSNDRTLTDSPTGLQTQITQFNDSKARSRSHIGGLTVQWNPTTKDAFEASGNYTYMTFPRFEDNRTTQSKASQTERQFTRYRDAFERQQEAEGSAAYTHTFREGQTLSIDYTYAMQDEVERNTYLNAYILPAQSDSQDRTVIRQRNNENLIRALYSDRINERNTLLVGYEAEIDRSKMFYLAEDLTGDNWIKNTDHSNDFLFRETVHSLYATWEHSFNRFAFMAGVRGEQSYITSNLLTLSQKVRDNYFLCYPTLHTSYQLGKNMELQLNYSLRVNRPEGGDLNPFPEYQDLYNLKAGNPYLRPEKIHSLEFGWQYKHGATTLILTPYYRYTFNKMTVITEVLDGGVMKSTKENMSSSRAAGAEAVLSSYLGHWCNFNLSGNLFYNTIDATDLGYSAKRGAMAWYASLNADFTLTRNLMFQVNTRYNSSELTPQGKRQGTYIMNVGARYDIPRYNLAFTATVSDLFDSYRCVIFVDTPAIHQRLERRRAPRIFYFGISYKFGSKGAKHADNQEIKYDEAL